jgi:hypothetical protein
VSFSAWATGGTVTLYRCSRCGNQFGLTTDGACPLYRPDGTPCPGVLALVVPMTYPEQLAEAMNGRR